MSVPVWLIILSDQLTIVALAGLYPANQLWSAGSSSDNSLLAETTFHLTDRSRKNFIRY